MTDSDNVCERAELASFDVTAWLLQSSCSLPVGQFLHSPDGDFSLHAAMSALGADGPGGWTRVWPTRHTV